MNAMQNDAQSKEAHELETPIVFGGHSEMGSQLVRIPQPEQAQRTEPAPHVK